MQKQQGKIWSVEKYIKFCRYTANYGKYHILKMIEITRSTSSSFNPAYIGRQITSLANLFATGKFSDFADS